MNPYDRSTAFGKRSKPNLQYYNHGREDLSNLSFFFYLPLFFYTAIGPDGMCCQSREFKEWHGCRSTKGVVKGVLFR